jgi:ubiquinone/menaquinone biosynthesis C-methylase UbiE
LVKKGGTKKMSDTKNKIKEYWNERSSTFDLSPGHVIGSIEEREAWKSLFQDKFGAELQKILDVGAGTGFLSLILAEMGYDVVGIDLSEEMMERAKEKAADRGVKLKVEFKVGDAENLPFETDFFDTIVNRAVLWTLPEPKKALGEWKRVLKPGGKLCFFLHEPHHDGITQGVRRQLGNVLILFLERRNPWYSLYNNKLGVDLPFRGGVEHTIITNLLDDAGFEQVSAEPMHEISRLKSEKMPCYRIGHNHNHIQYCYTAVKPEPEGG